MTVDTASSFIFGPHLPNTFYHGSRERRALEVELLAPMSVSVKGSSSS